LYNSPSYKNLFGDPGTMRGTDSFVEIHPEDQEKVKRIFQETVATGIGRRTEYRFVSEDGSVRHVESVGSVIKDETGQTNKVVVVSRDMTEHRQAVECLRQSETLYHSLVESLPQNIFRKDLAGRFTFGNQRFCQAVRAPLEQILGKTDFDFYPADLAAKYQEDDRTVLKTGEIFETVEENRPLGGEKSDVHVVKIPIYNAQGQITGIQGIYWDITKQKQAEEALLKTLADLKKSHEDLKAAQMQLIQAAKLESVGTLAAGVAHEVKNPLQTILMGLDFLIRNCPVHEATLGMVLADMRSAVKRADMIVRGLLHFSAAHQPDAKDEDLNAVMAQSLLLARYELTKSRIVLRGDLAPDLPRVRLDKAKMEQVFINLFMNAIHAMPHGGTLTVRTRSKRLARIEELDDRTAGNLKVGDTIVTAEVEDTGTGIPEENLAKIFDPFFTTKPTGVGTGLGLPVTKKIIELHGGTIDIKNAPDGGVQVTITLKAQSTEQQ
ncbi:MAG: PAS domain-containing protein, partial [Chloroflexi bacterium]|nr:PAS domain-containing protein [Chloroflexota bacterium]